MNKEIVESVADYFKDKHNNTLLTISTDDFEFDYSGNGVIDIRYNYEFDCVLIACIWFIESENMIGLYLYHDKYNGSSSHYRWDINDPKSIIEIEEYIEEHIEEHIKSNDEQRNSRICS